MHVGNARLNTRRLSARVGYSCGLAVLFFLVGAKSLQNAVAEGDTRTITMHHLHTNEDITITYKHNGQYDEAALDEAELVPARLAQGAADPMDPHLIDLVWEVQREANTGQPIQVVCGYRSPETNAMLRHRSAGVARFSQHMLGHAMDFYIPGIQLEKLREIGLRMQRGGVGFYPTSGSPFVHMDIADIRMWPRMSREELARVFPDGRTVQIPSDGRPMPGYALALADIKQHGKMPSANSLDAARAAGVDVGVLVASNERHSNPFARLLGLGVKDEDDEEEVTVASAVPTPMPAVTPPPGVTPAAAPQANVPVPPKRPVIAAIEHGAQVAEKATVAAAVKVADAASKVKLIRTADAAPLQPALQPLPAPSQQCRPRRSPTSRAAASQAPAAAVAADPAGGQQRAERQPGHRRARLLAGPGRRHGGRQSFRRSQACAQRAGRRASRRAPIADATTGAIGPFVNPNTNAGGSGIALSYAEPSAGTGAPAAAAPMGIAALRAAAPAQNTPVQAATVQTVPVQVAPVQQQTNGAPDGTTVAVKRTGNQASSVIMTASSTSVTVVKSDARFGNPWMRAIVMSPSVHAVPDHDGVRRPRHAHARGHDDQAGERGVHDFRRRSESGPRQRSLHRLGDRLHPDGELSGAQRVAAIVAFQGVAWREPGFHNHKFAGLADAPLRVSEYGFRGPTWLAGMTAASVQHAERVQIGLEDSLVLLALVAVLFAHAHHDAQRLDVEAVALGLGIDVADIVRDGFLFFFELFHAFDERLELILGETVGGLFVFDGGSGGHCVLLTMRA